MLRLGDVSLDGGSRTTALLTRLLLWLRHQRRTATTFVYAAVVSGPKNELTHPPIVVEV